MRIILLYEKYHVGGAQTYVDECVAQLRHNGDTVDLIAGSQINWTTIQLIIKNKYDCAFLHFLSPRFIAVVVYLLIVRIPITTVVHGVWIREFHSQLPNAGIIPLARYWIYQYLLCICSHKLVVLSDYAASVVCTTFPYIQHKICIIPGGVNLKTYHPASRLTRMKLRKSFCISHFATVVLVMSRLERRKGIYDAILAFSYYIKKYPNSMLCVVVPFGPYSQYELLSDYMNIIEEHKLSNHVRFMPSGSRKENAKYYQASDILLVSSKELEMFGLVTLEALASGCIPILYPNNGLHDVVRGINPLSIAFAMSPRALFRAMEGIMRLSNVQKNTIRLKGVSTARSYSWASVCNKLYLAF